jgi:hypothetical protein
LSALWSKKCFLPKTLLSPVVTEHPCPRFQLLSTHLYLVFQASGLPAWCVVL